MMRILGFIVASAVLLILYVRYLERTTVFVPDRDVLSTPEAIGIPFEDIYLTTTDGVRLNAWLVRPVDAPRGTLIFLHGNAGNIADRLGKIFLFRQMGLNVFIFDYRGYGNSEGSPTEQGMYLDAMAAHDYVAGREDLGTPRIIVYGASLGGAAAIDLATQRRVDGLIIDSSFSSASDMARHIFPFVPSFLVNIKMDSARKAAVLRMPKLFLHSRADEVVPFALGQKLYKAAADPKQFLEITGTHNDAEIFDQSVFQLGIMKFIGALP